SSSAAASRCARPCLTASTRRSRRWRRRSRPATTARPSGADRLAAAAASGAADPGPGGDALRPADAGRKPGRGHARDSGVGYTAAMAKKPWEHHKEGGSEADPLAARFVASLDYDKRLYRVDIRGSLAHANM